MHYREPLTPDLGPLPPVVERDPVAWGGRPDTTPYTQVHSPTAARIDPQEVERLVERIAATPRGLIIVGPDNSLRLSGIGALARQAGYPLLADPLSPARGRGDYVVMSYDAFLRDPHFVDAARPDLILRFGAMPTSKPVSQFLNRYPDCPQVVINGDSAWQDPTQLVGTMIHADPAKLSVALSQSLKTTYGDHRPAQAYHSAWPALWRGAERATQRAMREQSVAAPDLSEVGVFGELARLLPEGARLVVGNSMPIRDCDTFFWPERFVAVYGNRGANGIDGVTSTALGVAAMTTKTPTVLVIGDLAFYHDLNGLLAAKLHGLNLTVVLVNNDGGGIFSFLPQADYPDHFEQTFGTPTGLDFAPIVAAYGGTFTRVASWARFREAVTQGMEQGGLQVVEVPTDRARNVAQHRDLWQAVSRALVEQGVVPAEAKA
jgi:2-succinyl-5-enolpyruvyl-6-hydroxy-3-cyclohexene-1-carboxylate synthase